MFNVNIHSTTPIKIYGYWRKKGDRGARKKIEKLRRQVIIATREKALRNIVGKIQKTAVDEYMYKDGGSPEGRTKTTIRSGNLAKAVLSKNHPSHVEKIKASSKNNFRAIFGVKDNDQTPYATTQEAGRVIFGKPMMTFTLWDGTIRSARRVSVPSRAYMRPAYQDVVGSGDAIKYVNLEIQKIIKKMDFM